MKQALLRSAALLALFLPLAASGAETAKTGIVKGTITIGGKPAADAVVSIEGLAPQTLSSQPSTPSPKKTLMDQRDMKFIPRVLPVIAGTAVSFPNNDKTWHNVYSKSEAKEFDLGLYPAGETRSVSFDNPGVVRIFCNVHPQMEAFIVVKKHTHFAATDERGNYTLAMVPLGRHRLEVWHPDTGVKTVSFILAREGEVLAVGVNLRRQSRLR